MAQLKWPGDLFGQAWDANGVEILDRVVALDTETGHATIQKRTPDGKLCLDPDGDIIYTHKVYTAPIIFRPYPPERQAAMNTGEAPVAETVVVEREPP